MAIYDHVMLVDQSLCINCDACTLVCKQIYGTTDGIFRTQIDTYEHGAYPTSLEVFNKKACMHCTDALCVMSCPTKACHKNEFGLTVIDDRTCITCNYCAANCPYGVITFDRTKTIMEKCTLCDVRIENGLAPFCSEVCTPKAIKFGEREEMIAAGNARVDMLRNQGYEEATLYGTTEFEGLRVFLVLQYSPDKYNLPAETAVPMGKRVMQYLLSPIGGIAALAAIVGLVVNYSSSKKNKAG